MWERYITDVFENAKQSTPNDRFTDQLLVSLHEWAAGEEGSAELSTSKDTFATIRHKIAELAGIPLRDSSRRIPKKKGNFMSTPSPFDSLTQPATVPTELAPRITVQDINTAEPGPYY